MQPALRVISGGNVESAKLRSAPRHRRNFVCVMGRDPERNKIPRSHLWTGPPDALRFASVKAATLLP